MLALSPPVTLGSELARFLDATSLEEELEKPMVSLSSSAGTERVGGRLGEGEKTSKVKCGVDRRFDVGSTDDALQTVLHDANELLVGLDAEVAQDAQDVAHVGVQRDDFLRVEGLQDDQDRS